MNYDGYGELGLIWFGLACYFFFARVFRKDNVYGLWVREAHGNGSVLFSNIRVHTTQIRAHYIRCYALVLLYSLL